LGSKTRFLNKALVTVGLKPAISRLIEKISPEIPIVIALGYGGNTLRDVLALGYPNHAFEFVTVDPFEGSGSGLGFTLLAAREHLQTPFVFCACDTLFTGTVPPPDRGWVAYASLPSGRSLNEFRCLTLQNRETTYAIDLTEKGQHRDGSVPYVGMAGIPDYVEFWNELSAGGSQAVEIGESYALERLLKTRNYAAVNIDDWCDTGSLSGLIQANQRFLPEEKATVLEKENEAIWFIGNQVIKFSDDVRFISQRVDRAHTLQGFVPTITGSGRNVYAYEKANGTILSEGISVAEFGEFLNWLESFWKTQILRADEPASFRQACDRFYRDKTFERVKLFHEKFGPFAQGEGNINGRDYATTEAILKRTPWHQLSNGTPVRLHGDLHFENVLRVGGDRKFMLLDWRQNFSGILEYGDLYYDLAKLNHGLIVNHGLIALDRYEVRTEGNSICFEFERLSVLIECEEFLYSYLARTGRLVEKTRIVTALIFLNIAALHHEPYARLLYCLGKTMLSDAIDRQTGTETR
jgi:hypothetical protein